MNKIILATNSFRDHCLIKTLYWAGLRRSEVQNLDTRDIDFNRKRITLTGKGDKTRVVAIINDEFLGNLKLSGSEIKEMNYYLLNWLSLN